MGQYSPIDQMKQAMKKKSPMDVNNTPPLIDQNQTFGQSPTLQSPQATGPSAMAQTGAGILGAIGNAFSQPQEDTPPPMPEWQTPTNPYKRDAPQQTPPISQAGSQLGSSALL